MQKHSQPSVIEYWGGIECSLNRVQNHYFDQLHFAHHYARPGDIERIASLGISKLRYPVLWESHQLKYDSPIDWKWSNARLNEIRTFGIDPVVGLIHHGSGPPFTSLLEDSFATGLASYASRVAKQFPWIEHYVPVNEPLTTARFSGLYGFWYPHLTDGLACMRMLLIQLKAVVLAMREIRKVNSKAKLIQTEDLAKTYSSSTLQYQAEFENHRRWLTFDFLCGSVNKDHPLWPYLLWLGLSESELMFFADNPCVPDVCGFNYYLTSERYLDERLESYPDSLHGGNEVHKYVDTEAIRVDHPSPSGLKILLDEAWNRLHLPIALTEVFLSCHRYEQALWIKYVHDQCMELRKENPALNLKAMTFWALLGEYGWNKLVTSADGEYESGAFDVQANGLEETLSAEYIRHLTMGTPISGDIFGNPGWWMQGDRFHKERQCVMEPA